MPAVTTDVIQRLAKALAYLGEDIFKESQKNVPVLTGKLKASGVKRVLPNGFEIQYTTDYARDVEFGRKGGEVSQEPWIQNVPTHIRRTKNGRVRVKAHQKEYTSGKPMKMPDGSWRVFKASPQTVARLYLTKAMEDILTPALTQNMGLQKYINY